VTPTERKAGKRERIRALLNNLQAEQRMFGDHQPQAEALDGLGLERSRSVSGSAPLAGPEPLFD
jgi:hypothetical protein